MNSAITVGFNAADQQVQRLAFTCCEFRPRRGIALGIWKRFESLLRQGVESGATQGWLLGPQGRCVNCE
ncbi:MAG: hypothetical protein QF614_00310 [SAR324 cluster bacterium]|nr:hypothetical protein [SAR324 cluster bacterium]